MSVQKLDRFVDRGFGLHTCLPVAYRAPGPAHDPYAGSIGVNGPVIHVVALKKTAGVRVYFHQMGHGPRKRSRFQCLLQHNPVGMKGDPFAEGVVIKRHAHAPTRRIQYGG
jgi:hypothetical protein